MPGSANYLFSLNPVVSEYLGPRSTQLRFGFVYFHVGSMIAGSSKEDKIVGAEVNFFFSVDLHVSVKGSSMGAGETTHITPMWLFSSVDHHVSKGL